MPSIPPIVPITGTKQKQEKRLSTLILKFVSTRISILSIQLRHKNIFLLTELSLFTLKFKLITKKITCKITPV